MRRPAPEQVLDGSPLQPDLTLHGGNFPSILPPTCVGGDPRLVGRKTPSSVGDGESRCADDNPLGFWLSLPKAGHCPGQTRPGADAWKTGCSWSVVKRHHHCWFKHGFLRICNADAFQRKGFARTSRALEAAFASDDPSKGGCADSERLKLRVLWKSDLTAPVSKCRESIARNSGSGLVSLALNKKPHGQCCGLSSGSHFDPSPNLYPEMLPQPCVLTRCLVP